jgi:phosphate transport system substrate-binding protein
VADPIVVAYNLSGVKLNLSGDTVAKIFQGQITSWDDPAIVAENPKAKLPSSTITVAVRSDSSGTTENFTKWLTKAAPTTYTLGASSKPSWPPSDQQGAQNTGVAKIVQDTDGAIGYVDYSDAQALQLTADQERRQQVRRPVDGGCRFRGAEDTVNFDLT